MWILGFTVAGVVVVVVAALLIGILLQARRILRLARAANEIVAQIDANTRSVWALTTTNAVAGQILEGAQTIDRNAAAVVDGLTGGTGRSDAA
jgi:hypothetical protein